MSDLINGREMLNRYQVDLCYGIACKDCSMSTEEGGCRVEEWIDKFPSADRPSAVDLSSVYSTAYKSGYEKGKADEKRWWSEHCAKCTDADRPQGEWIFVENKISDRKIKKCSVCGLGYVSLKPDNYCPHCGARMKGADDAVDAV